MTPLSPSGDLFAHRLQLFTGKGGVGKSSVVAALALEAAERGYRPLVVELGHRASMEAVFGQGPIGYQPHPVGHGVHAMNLGVEGALGDYVADQLKLGSLAKLILDNQALHRFLYAAPGVPEVVTLNKLRALVEAPASKGQILPGGMNALWHPIYVDLDATGHALMLLELPRVLHGLIGASPLRRLIARVSELLADSDLTILHLVTLPTELPVQETVELYSALASGHRVQLGRLFVNQVPGEPLSYAALSALEDLTDAAFRAGDAQLSDDIALGRTALRRYARVRDQLKRLRSQVNIPVVELPQLARGDINLQALGSLGKIAARAGDKA